MKSILAVIGAIVVLVALFIYFATAGVVRAGDNFIGAIQKHDLPMARYMLAKDLLKETSEFRFEQEMKELGLTDVKSVSWSNRKTQNDNGLVSGTATTISGREFHIQMKFHKQDGVWKIGAIDTDN